MQESFFLVLTLEQADGTFRLKQDRKQRFCPFQMDRVLGLVSPGYIRGVGGLTRWTVCLETVLFSVLFEMVPLVRPREVVRSAPRRKDVLAQRCFNSKS